jgi:hypothetical protein
MTNRSERLIQSKVHNFTRPDRPDRPNRPKVINTEAVYGVDYNPDRSLTVPADNMGIINDTLDLAPEIADLTYDAWRSLIVDNAGGKSSVSEAVSIDYFIKNFGATRILVEKEVEYWIDYKMVDYICSINDQRIGVSVTRAMAVKTDPSGRHVVLDLHPDKFTLDDAVRLLKKKLYGLIVSRNGVTKNHCFYKSILHIWAASQDIADRLNLAWTGGHVDVSEFGLDIRGVLVVMITVCSDPTLYLNSHHHRWLREARRSPRDSP